MSLVADGMEMALRLEVGHPTESRLQVPVGIENEVIKNHHLRVI